MTNSDRFVGGCVGGEALTPTGSTGRLDSEETKVSSGIRRGGAGDRPASEPQHATAVHQGLGKGRVPGSAPWAGRRSRAQITSKQASKQANGGD